MDNIAESDWVSGFLSLKTPFFPKTCWRSLNNSQTASYVGFEKDYPCKELNIPQKKPRNGSLSESEKESNRQKARERITVEHSLCGLKRYRILTNRMRMKDIELYNDIIEVCAGIWNFYLDR